MSRTTPLTHIDGPEAFQAAFRVSRETLDKLKVYQAVLQRWQRAVNLVAPSTLDHVWHRHFADSAQLAQFVPEGARSLADLGSGAGFPGLVLALMLGEARPLQTWLIESDQRKAAFLKDVARQTGIAVDILSTRIESQQTHAKVGQVDVVTARALAPMDRLVELAEPYLAAHTIGLFLKGREAEREIAKVSRDDREALTKVPSSTHDGGTILLLRRHEASTKGACQ